MRSKNFMRRRSAIGTIKNCLFNNEEHWWLVVEKKILLHLLLPLVVNTPFSEQEMVGMEPLLWMRVRNIIYILYIYIYIYCLFIYTYYI